MKAKSRGMDFSLGKNITEEKKYVYYGSSRYYGEQEKMKPPSYSVFQNPYGGMATSVKNVYNQDLPVQVPTTTQIRNE